MKITKVTYVVIILCIACFAVFYFSQPMHGFDLLVVGLLLLYFATEVKNTYGEDIEDCTIGRWADAGRTTKTQKCFHGKL
ncbi:MAG: hypothetical protein FWF66_01015 [Candidatus Bathyarchaeota archaeon]|nr:hypothetical protein [Candidatus Termiticorpusculum sp.]